MASHANDLRMTSVRSTHDWTIGQWLTLISGLVFLAAGIAGFIVTGFDDFAGNSQHEMLLGFMVNPLHNTVHLLFGVLALASFMGAMRSMAFGWLLIVVYGATLIYGLFAVGEEWDILNLNVADNWLHAGFVALGAIIVATSRIHMGHTVRSH